MSNSPPRVFLSYARKDGEAFATALRRRLAAEEPEITLWHDRAELEGGVGWWTQIEAALDQVKFLVIVMTPQAMASEITRREWRYARQRGVIVYPVKGVPDDQLDYAAIPAWMGKAHFFDIGRWTGSEWADAKEWQTFTLYLKSDRQLVRVPFLAPDLPPGFVERPREFDEILSHLLHPARDQSVAITTALQGAGGYGKTTLAIALCHDSRVVEHFDDGVLWTSLGQTPRVVDELAHWYRALTGQRPAFLDERDAVISLAEKLQHRRCLLVVDDVWERRHLEPFLRLGKSNRRLITTRRTDLIQDTARIRVDQMTADEAVRLVALPVSVGAVPHATLAALARRLGEWPLLLTLAAAVIRSRLARGDSASGALTYVERALQKHGVTAFDRSDATQRDEAVRRTVDVSLQQLSSEDRACLLDLAIFPEDVSIPLTTLERLWGMDDVDTADCVRRLDDVALVALDLHRGVVTLHDVMRAYLRQRVDLQSVHARLVDGYGDLQRLPDAYSWGWVAYHLVEAGRHEQLHTLLLTPEWLDAQIRAVGVYAVIRDYSWMQGYRDLDLVHGALRLSMWALAADPTQFSEQLLGRLPTGHETLDKFRTTLRQLGPVPRLHARWANLQRPSGALRQTLLLHRSIVTGALLLPDGRVVSWGLDCTLQVWDVETCEGRSLMGHEGLVHGALLLPDGRVLSWSEDGTLRAWDLTAGEARSLMGHEGVVRGALLLPDGRVLSWSGDRTLRVWDLTTGEARSLTGHEGSVQGALLLPDGRVLSWGTDPTLRVWDLTSGEARSLTGHEQSVLGALLLPDGGALSWSVDLTLRVWELTTAQSRALTGYGEWIHGALALPDGRVLSWTSNGLRVWDPMTGKSRVLPGHVGRVVAAQMLPNGWVLSWGLDTTLRMWDPMTGDGRLVTTHVDYVGDVLVLSDGRALSWTGDESGANKEMLRVSDLSTGDHWFLMGHELGVVGALELCDNRVLSWGIDGTLRVWNLANRGNERLTGHDQAIDGALLLADGRVLSWSAEATLRIWDLATGEGRTLTGHDDAVGGALTLADGRVLSWSKDATLRLWDPTTGGCRALTGHERMVNGALVLPDGRVLSWSEDATLRIWDLTSGASRILTGHEEGVGDAVALSDGRVLSWSGHGPLRVWDLTTGESRSRKIRGVVAGALGLRDGRILSWGGDGGLGGALQIWDLASDQIRPLVGHDAWVWDVLMLPDGRALSWSQDRTLRVWDLATGAGHLLTGHEAMVVGAFVLPDGRVLSWSQDGMLWVWNLATGFSHPLANCHEGRVRGALALSDGYVLSWAHDRALVRQSLDNDERSVDFYFDATPTAVVVDRFQRLFVGDALGHVHFLELIGARLGVPS